MATNVTEKDKALQEVIDWCEQREIEGLRLANALLLQRDMAAYGVVKGQINAYEKRQPATAFPCLATPARCLPRCLTKARTRRNSYVVQTQIQRIWVSNVRQTTSNQGMANGKIPREPQSKDNTHSLPAQCPRGHISTSWFSHAALASRQWKELVDEYKGKDTK